MKKWQIIQYVALTIMLGSSTAQLWVDGTVQFVLEMVYISALLLVVVSWVVTFNIQNRKLEQESKDLEDTFMKFCEAELDLPWISTKTALPKDGQKVIVRLLKDDEDGHYVMLAIYRDGHFNHLPWEPYYWMPIPKIPKHSHL